MQPSELARRRDIAATLAVKAAARAARMRDAGLGEASLKGAQDFLTAADGATETFLREQLARHFPGEEILGEEQGGPQGSDLDPAGPLWVLDPIDGTSNFARGGDRWCVSIGMVLDGRAVVGAIARHAPADIFAGARGCGATLNGAPIRAASTTDLSRATVEIGWSLRRPLVDFVGLVDRVMAAGAGMRCAGSGSLGLVETAAGRLDAYLEPHINSWDAAAALAIAREAGCWMNDFESGDWLAHGNPIAFAAPALGPTLGAMMRA